LDVGVALKVNIEGKEWEHAENWKASIEASNAARAASVAGVCGGIPSSE
jgi:hypothetical protein